MQVPTIEGFKLSPQQKRLWSLQQESDAYRVQCAILLEGALQAEALKQALQMVVERHAILRTTFQYVPGIKSPFQFIAESDGVSWRETDVTDFAAGQREAEIQALFDEGKLTPFDSRQASFISTLITVSTDRHVLLIGLSPLCADEWTLSDLVGEISRAYAASVQGEEHSSEAVQYIQFSEWQSTLLEGDDAEIGKAYWKKQDLSALHALRLPFERTPLADAPFEPASLAVEFAPHVVAKIESNVEQYDTTASTFLLACWQTLIRRLTREPEIIIGYIGDGRAYEVLHGALGLFAKWLPVRCHFQGDSRFKEVLRQVDEAIHDGHEWQEYFIAEESTDLNGNGTQSVFPYIVFNYEERPASYVAGNVTFSISRQYVCTERFHVRLACVRRADTLTAEFHYDSGLYAQADISRLAAQFETLVNSVFEHESATISELEIVSEAERHQLLIGWNNTATAGTHDHCLHHLFEAQAARTPHDVALVYEEQQLTYAELNQRANQLGHYLQRLCVGAETRVGLCVERSLEMIVGLLAILKAGGAYLPLDPAYPRERLRFMLEETSAPVLLTQQHLLEVLPAHGAKTICLDTQWTEMAQESLVNPVSSVQAENLAYLIYTSGSTGAPKGVCVTHRNLCNYVHAILDTLALPRHASFATVSTLAADLGHTALYPALCSGSTLHVISAERASDPALLGEYFGRHLIDVLKIVPSHLRALLASHEASQVLPRERLVLGGEATHWELVEQVGALKPECHIINHYGPTETTVGALTYSLQQQLALAPGLAAKLEARPRLAATLPLGTPLANVQAYVLDHHLRPVPIGVAGEIYLGGAGLARGYLNEPSLTAEKFLPHPFSQEAGARLYGTGDVARRLPDGNIEFLGRVDQQVKLRGYRIELGEVEAALRKHAAVREATVVVRADEEEEKRLVGYVVLHRQYREMIEGRRRYGLPNGMAIVQQNRNETDYLYQEIFAENNYFKYGIEVGDEACVFDVGANIGMFTLYVSQQCRRARIYAFEPIPEVCAALRINAELYGGDVKVFECGMSDREREETFTFYPRQSMMSGLSTYADAAYEREVVKRSMQNEQQRGATEMGMLLVESEELLEGRFVEKRERCRLRRLSDVMTEEGVERIDLLKVDVQRAELDVLRGIEEEDWTKIGQIAMEVHDRADHESEGRLREIEELLKGRGFAVVTEQEEALKGTDRYNLYAIRNERRAKASADRQQPPSDAPPQPDGQVRVSGVISSAELRSYLRESVPEYMVPTWVLMLEEMPLTANGKIDRQALPTPERGGAEQEQKATEVRTPVEEIVAGIWAEVLGLEKIRVEENFFEMGGHSLLATQVISRVREAFGMEIHLRSLFERPTVRGLAEVIEQQLQSEQGLIAPPLSPVARDGKLPLSFAQQRLWFLDQLDPRSSRYNCPGAVRLSGQLNAPALEQTFSEIITRHEILRTNFPEMDGQAGQVIAPTVRFSFPVIDLSGMDEAEREREAGRLAQEEAERPFDLSHGPLLRASLLKLSPSEHVLLFTMHHIISDGWSMNILISEVGTLYEAYSRGRKSPLSELTIQYADYAVWQRAWLTGRVLEEQLGYWKEQLGGAPTVLELPVDHSRPTAQGYRGARHAFALTAELSEKLKEMSRREGVTLFMTLLAAFQTLLHRYTEQDQISVGTPIANRNQAETEGLIGFFVNTLVLRTDLSGDPSFSEVLRRVREVCLGAYGHQDVPFEKLVEVMQPERSLNHSPLFQVWLALQNAPTTELSLKNLSLRQFRLQTTTTRFDLGLLVKDTAQGFSGVFEYNSDLFERDTIDRLLRLYETLLHSIVGQPESRLSVLEQILDDEERKQQSIKTKEFEEADKYMLKHIKRKPISRSLP